MGQNCALYDPVVSSWTSVTVPGDPDAPFSTLADGRMLRAGGQQSDSIFSSDQSFLIDPGTLAGVMTGNLAYSTAPVGMQRLPDSRILIAGGWEFGFIMGSPNDAVQIYDPATELWSEVSSMKYHEGMVSTVLLGDGRVLVGGGSLISTNQNYTAEIYDPTIDLWTTASGVQWLPGEAATLLPDGSVLLSGGEGPSTLVSYGPSANQTTIWNPATGSVWQGRPMTIPRSRHSVAVLPDGTALAMGGFTTLTTGNEVTSSVEVLSYGQPRAGPEPWLLHRHRHREQCQRRRILGIASLDSRHHRGRNVFRRLAGGAGQ